MRRTQADYAGSAVGYLGSASGDRLDDAAIRVTFVQWAIAGGGTVVVSEYAYLGVASLAGSDRGETTTRPGTRTPTT